MLILQMNCSFESWTFRDFDSMQTKIRLNFIKDEHRFIEYISTGSIEQNKRLMRQCEIYTLWSPHNCEQGSQLYIKSLEK